MDENQQTNFLDYIKENIDYESYGMTFDEFIEHFCPDNISFTNGNFYNNNQEVVNPIMCYLETGSEMSIMPDICIYDPTTGKAFKSDGIEIIELTQEEISLLTFDSRYNVSYEDGNLHVDGNASNSDISNIYNTLYNVFLDNINVNQKENNLSNTVFNENDYFLCQFGREMESAGYSASSDGLKSYLSEQFGISVSDDSSFVIDLPDSLLDWKHFENHPECYVDGDYRRRIYSLDDFYDSSGNVTSELLNCGLFAPELSKWRNEIQDLLYYEAIGAFGDNLIIKDFDKCNDLLKYLAVNNKLNDNYDITFDENVYDNLNLFFTEDFSKKLGVDLSKFNFTNDVFFNSLYSGFDTHMFEYLKQGISYDAALDKIYDNIVDNQPVFEDLGLNLSVRNDTTIDELKLSFSGNVSNVEYIPVYKYDRNGNIKYNFKGEPIVDKHLYQLSFHNGQTFTFDESQYSGFISQFEGIDENIMPLEDLIYHSDANIAYVASQLFSNYFSGANVDIRAVSENECMVIINGTEYRYSIEQIANLVENYHDKDLNEIMSSKISSFIKTDDKGFKVVLNPITNEYCLKYDGDQGYTNIDKSMIDFELLKTTDYVKELMLKDPNFDITSLSNDELMKLMIGDMGFTNESTVDLPIIGEELTENKTNKYISKKIFNPVISVNDSNMYLNFASFLCSTSFSSIGDKISSIRGSYFSGFSAGSFVNDSINILSEVDLLCQNLSKQINYSVSLLMNYDESLKDDLDKIIDEFFEVSSVSYSGEDKVDLFNNEINEASNFFKSFSEEMYHKANEIALSLSGYITLTKEEYDKLKADGYDVESCSSRDITGNSSDDDQEAYYYISLENADKILSSSFNVTNDNGSALINGAYELLNEQQFTYDDYDANKYNSLTILSKSYISYLENYVNGDVESKVKEQRSAYAFSNLSPYFDDIISDEYVETLNDMRINFNNKDYFPFKYDDSLTVGMNALRYMKYYKHYDLYYELKSLEELFYSNQYSSQADIEEQIIEIFKMYSDLRGEEFNKYFNDDFVGKYHGEIYDIFACLDYDSSNLFNEDVEFMEKIRTNRASNSLLAYNYNQMKGYEKAVKYLEGVYDDGDIDPGDWLKYVGKCFVEGFVSTFSGFADLVNPEYDSSDYMKSFLAEMMVSTGFDEEDIQNKYKTGQISKAEYNLKQVVIDAYKSGDLKLESLANAGKISKITGEVTFEFLLTLATMGSAQALTTGLKLGSSAALRITSAAAMIKDIVQVGKGIAKDKRNYINNKYGDLYDSVAEFERRNINKRANTAAYGAAAINFGLRSIGNAYALSKGSSISKSDSRFARFLGKVDKNGINDMKYGKLQGKLWGRITSWAQDELNTDVLGDPVASWVKTSFLGRLGAGAQAVYNNVVTTGGGRGASVVSTAFYNLYGITTGDFGNVFEKDFFDYGWENLIKAIERAITGINIK